MKIYAIIKRMTIISEGVSPCPKRTFELTKVTPQIMATAIAAICQTACFILRLNFRTCESSISKNNKGRSKWPPDIVDN